MFPHQPPATAAWQHEGARVGFEVVFFQAVGDGWRIEGQTTAVEGGQVWSVGYAITLDARWVTQAARVRGRSAAGAFARQLESDGGGHWTVDGEPAHQLDGCLDVDLEASAVTNALPVRRMQLAVGARSSAPAAYVRAQDLSVGRLDQYYQRTADEGSRQCYRYAAPAFAFERQLTYDASGLVLTYPGIAVRAG